MEVGTEGRRRRVIGRSSSRPYLHSFLPPPTGPRLDPYGWYIAMALPKVVIVGRPNVGKSSLFNWLAGRRIAIVDDMAGVTRDRVGTLVQLGDDVNPRFIELIDTGGIGMVDRDDLSEDVERQIDTAMNEADLILFVVDIRDELMPLDEEVAQRLRYLKTPVILVMNKADYPEPGPPRRRVLQARPRQADRRLGPAEPQQEAVAASGSRRCSRRPTRAARPTPR